MDALVNRNEIMSPRTECAFRQGSLGDVSPKTCSPNVCHPLRDYYGAGALLKKRWLGQSMLDFLNICIFIAPSD